MTTYSQRFWLGSKKQHDVLVVGAAGIGKSTSLNVAIKALYQWTTEGNYFLFKTGKKLFTIEKRVDGPDVSVLMDDPSPKYALSLELVLSQIRNQGNRRIPVIFDRLESEDLPTEYEDLCSLLPRQAAESRKV